MGRIAQWWQDDPDRLHHQWHGVVAGGVFNYPNANLTLNSCTISDNTVNFGNGAGIYNAGTLTASYTTIANNVFAGASGSGGGLDNSGTANLTDCTIAGNGLNARGGGVFNTGNLTLYSCTISGNSGSPGGVASYGGTANLTNCPSRTTARSSAHTAAFTSPARRP